MTYVVNLDPAAEQFDYPVAFGRPFVAVLSCSSPVEAVQVIGKDC